MSEDGVPKRIFLRLLTSLTIVWNEQRVKYLFFSLGLFCFHDLPRGECHLFRLMGVARRRSTACHHVRSIPGTYGGHQTMRTPEPKCIPGVQQHRQKNMAGAPE